MWDVFISHASEDKDYLVRILAKQLVDIYKVSVWYDEYSLEYGDSLIESIENGLKNSRYGIVVLSKNFFKKSYTKHEFNGLKTKELLLNKKVIIPIWYDITKQEVFEYSTTLADKFAIYTNKNVDVNDLAIKIIKIVRPDIYENISRMEYIENTLETALKRSVNLSVPFLKKLNMPIRHKEISIKMKARLKLIYNAIKDVDMRSYDEYEEDFRKNINIDREIIITELITAAYIECISEKKLSFKEKKYIYIITLALGEVENLNIPLNLNDIRKYAEITKFYIRNINAYPSIDFIFKQN